MNSITFTSTISTTIVIIAIIIATSISVTVAVTITITSIIVIIHIFVIGTTTILIVTFISNPVMNVDNATAKNNASIVTSTIIFIPALILLLSLVITVIRIGTKQS